MMTTAAVAAGVLIGGCEDRERERPVAIVNDATDVAIDVNAVQSIMRPAVIEETQPTPTPEPVPPPPTRATIAFASGSTLDEEGKVALDALLAAPTLSPDMLFVVRGHSDAVGNDEDNLVTSRKRAEAVAAYLKEKGVASARITVIALGERRPVAPSAQPDGSDDPEGRARNRRVEVVVEPPAPATSTIVPTAADEATGDRLQRP